MPTIVTEIPSRPALAELPRKRWTREDCVALEESGFWNQQHLELIDGEPISKLGKKRPHTVVLGVVLGWLHDTFGREYVDVETSIDVAPNDNPINEAEPDLTVLAKLSREIQDANPQPDEIRLVVEISDLSVRFDRSIKAILYARAQTLEYWVVDIQGRRLIVHRDAREGQYQSITAYSEGESVSPLAAPDYEFPVAEACSGVPKK
jgi:Uma2 family endonuclease